MRNIKYPEHFQPKWVPVRLLENALEITGSALAVPDMRICASTGKFTGKDFHPFGENEIRTWKGCANTGYEIIALSGNMSCCWSIFSRNGYRFGGSKMRNIKYLEYFR